MTSNRSLSVLIVMLVLFSAGTLALSRVRPIDGDEGYYASAARLVAEGETPYADFFYPQMPYLPYVYAPLYQAVGSSLVGMRLLSVLAGVLTLVLWGALLRARLGDRPLLVAAGILLMALNPHFVSWNVTVKTYALANLGVVAALWASDRGLAGRGLVWFPVAGLMAGCVVGVRLLYLPWALALLVVLAVLGRRRPQAGTSTIGAALAGVGLLLALVPALRLFLDDPERFRFNNLDYHRLRFNPLDRAAAEGEPTLPQAVAAALELGRAILLNPAMLLLVVLAVLGALAVRRADRDGADDLAGLHAVAVVGGVGAVVHTAVCLLPDPVYTQYFTAPLVPLLAPLALLGLADLGHRLRRPAAVLAGFGAVAAVLTVVDLQIRQVGMDPSPVWQPARVAAVGDVIKEHTARHDMVLAFWSGYVFESGRDFVPGMENHFALGVSEQLPLNRKLAYHVAGKEMLLRALLTKAPTVVVLGAWMHEVNTTLEQEHLPVIVEEMQANYDLAWMEGEVKVLIRKSGPGAEF